MSANFNELKQCHKHPSIHLFMLLLLMVVLQSWVALCFSQNCTEACENVLFHVTKHFHFFGGSILDCHIKKKHTYRAQLDILYYGLNGLIVS